MSSAEPEPSPSEDAEPRRYAKGVRRRQQILDNAVEVFAERGPEGTSLRAIAEALDVSHAALRHYFESRDALLIEVLRQRDEGTARDIGTDAPVLARMTAAAKSNSRIPGLIALYTTMMAASIASGNDEAHDFFFARYRDARRDIADELREVVAARGGRVADAEGIAAIIIAVFDGLQVQWLLDPGEVDLADTMALFERLIDRPAG